MFSGNQAAWDNSVQGRQTWFMLFAAIGDVTLEILPRQLLDEQVDLAVFSLFCVTITARPMHLDIDWGV
jgi:hypothetical protein